MSTQGVNTKPIGELLLDEPTHNDLRTSDRWGGGYQQISGADEPNHGLTGTEKQKKIILLAVDHGHLSAGEVAEMLDTHQTYVGQVLRRADSDLWTDLFVPWDEVDGAEDEEEQYIELLEEACDEIELPEVEQ